MPASIPHVGLPVRVWRHNSPLPTRMHRGPAAAAGTAAGSEDDEEEENAAAAGPEADVPAGDEAEASDDDADDAAPAADDDPASDSSEDERPNRNTVGDVPLDWYRAEEHIGYDKQGDRIMKKERKDKLDLLLERNDSAKASAASCARGTSAGWRE